MQKTFAFPLELVITWYQEYSLSERVVLASCVFWQSVNLACTFSWRWKEAVFARKKLKRQMRAFPAAPCYVDPKDKLKALSPSAECPIAREHLIKRIVNLGHAGNLGTACLQWVLCFSIYMKEEHLAVTFFLPMLWWYQDDDVCSTMSSCKWCNIILTPTSHNALYIILTISTFFSLWSLPLSSCYSGDN